jgi:hypothetical protein
VAPPGNQAETEKTNINLQQREKSDYSTKVVMSHFCHAEPVEACRDIKHLHSPFDGLRVTVVTFVE